MTQTNVRLRETNVSQQEQEARNAVPIQNRNWNAKVEDVSCSSAGRKIRIANHKMSAARI